MSCRHPGWRSALDTLILIATIVVVSWLLASLPRVPHAVSLVLAVLITLPTLWRLSSVRAAVVGPTVLRVETDRPLVALTFDDGPTVAYTNPIVDLLAAHDAKATFFVNGEALERHPELGLDLLAAGHQLANHSWSHPRLVFRSRETLRHEVESTDRILAELGVPGPPAFRPPYGKRLWDLHHVLGPRPAVLWDIEPESYPAVASDPARIAEHVLDRVRPGSIILLHPMMNSRQTTRDALPAILAGLRSRGLHAVTLDTLLAAGTAR